MKRRSFFSRVFGLAAASAAVPEVLNPAEFTVTLTPVRYSSFNLETGEWMEWLEVNREIIRNTIAASPLVRSRE